MNQLLLDNAEQYDGTIKGKAVFVDCCSPPEPGKQVGEQMHESLHRSELKRDIIFDATGEQSYMKERVPVEFRAREEVPVNATSLHNCISPGITSSSPLSLPSAPSHPTPNAINLPSRLYHSLKRLQLAQRLPIPSAFKKSTGGISRRSHSAPCLASSETLPSSLFVVTSRPRAATVGEYNRGSRIDSQETLEDSRSAVTGASGRPRDKGKGKTRQRLEHLFNPVSHPTSSSSWTSTAASSSAFLRPTGKLVKLNDAYTPLVDDTEEPVPHRSNLSLVIPANPCSAYTTALSSPAATLGSAESSEAVLDYYSDLGPLPDLAVALVEEKKVNLFEARLPRELQLQMVAALVDVYELELYAMQREGQWRDEQSSEKWVGKLAGLREILKVGQVSTVHCIK